MKSIIGVMGAGETSEEEYQAAYHLGKLIAENEWVLLTGGRDKGVMDAASKGAKASGGLTIGVIPDFDLRHASDGVDIPIVTGMGSARNAINVLSSHVVVACHGRSSGTISEIALAINCKKPVVLLNCIPECVALFQKVESEQVYSVRTPEETVAIIRNIVSR